MPSIPFSFISSLSLSLSRCSHAILCLPSWPGAGSWNCWAWRLDCCSLASENRTVERCRKSQDKAATVHWFAKNIVTCLHLLPMLPTCRTFSKETLMHWTFTIIYQPSMQSHAKSTDDTDGYHRTVTIFFFWSNVRFDWEWFEPPGISVEATAWLPTLHFCSTFASVPPFHCLATCHKAEEFTGFTGPSSTFAGLESDLGGDNGQRILHQFFIIMCAKMIKDYQWCLSMSAAVVVLAD